MNVELCVYSVVQIVQLHSRTWKRLLERGIRHNVHPTFPDGSVRRRTCLAHDLYLAQIHPDVDQVASQSRKTEKIASSYVAQSGASWLSFHAATCCNQRRAARPTSYGEH